MRYWDPREYFLTVLSSRIQQVTTEWRIIIAELEIILKSTCGSPFQDSETTLQPKQERSIFQSRKSKHNKTVDDITLSRPEIYDWIVLILHQFKQLIAKTLGAWESFEEGEVCFFGLEGSDSRKDSLLAVIRKQVSDLKALHDAL